jgi:hypothetical protein
MGSARSLPTPPGPVVHLVAEVVGHLALKGATRATWPGT